MTAQQPLERDLISRPELWQLHMRLSSTALDVMLLSPMEHNSLILRHFDLDPDAASPLAALEEVVYQNPLLLSDFSKSSCIIDNKECLLIPSEVTDIDDRESLLLAACPDAADMRLLTNGIGARNATMMWAVDAATSAFLERTFFNIDLVHRLTPLCRYFLSSASRANTARIYANMRPEAVDVIVTDRDSLLLANTFASSTPTDILYYILAVYRSLAIDPAAGELLVAGDAAVREEATPLLRDYIGYVMPVIFPSAIFKAGREAMKAPFDLIVHPLCE